MFGNLIYSARLAAQRTAISLAAAILMLVGVAFLTAAGWIALAAAYSSLLAATVIGCLYMGLGLILLAVASLRRPLPPPPPPAPAPTSIAGLAGAFLQGIGAGIAAGASTRHPPPPAPPPPPPPPV